MQKRLLLSLCLSFVMACGEPPFCGDGEIDFELGEDCDDANQSNGDSCDNTRAGRGRRSP